MCWVGLGYGGLGWALGYDGGRCGMDKVGWLGWVDRGGYVRVWRGGVALGKVGDGVGVVIG